MPIACTCSGCGQSYRAPEAVAGKRVRCKACGGAMTVPAASGPEPRPAAVEPGARTAAAMVEFTCGHCGRVYRVPEALGGRSARCKGCGAGVQVPGAPAQEAGVRSRPAPATIPSPYDEDADDGDAPDPYALADLPPARPARPAPNEQDDEGDDATASPLPRPARARGPARAGRSGWLAAASDTDDILNKLCFWGIGLIVIGTVFWGLTLMGITLRSRADRIMGRPGDPVLQAWFGRIAGGAGALLILGAYGGATLRYATTRTLPRVNLVGLIGWLVGPLLILWPTSLMILSGFLDGPPVGG